MDVHLDSADGKAERRSALRMLRRLGKRHWVRPKTLGADKGYDDGPFLHELENKRQVTPHVASRSGPIRAFGPEAVARRKARDRRRTKGYQTSQRVRRRTDQVFGWLKTIAGLRKTRFIGRWKTQLYAYGAAAAYNFMRIPKLMPT